MLLVGDKIKQVKEIMGFNHIGEEFIINNFDGKNVYFSNPSLGHGFMTIDECNEYFEKIQEKVEEVDWSEWSYYFFCVYEYRTKGELIEMRRSNSDNSVFAKPCEGDVFDLKKGLNICEYKIAIRDKQREIKKLRREIHQQKQFIRENY